jgi:hypothetical protein
MSQTSVRRCQDEICRAPVIWFDHGKPYPAAGVVVLCMDPIRVRCFCGQVSEWVETRASR